MSPLFLDALKDARADFADWRHGRLTLAQLRCAPPADGYEQDTDAYLRAYKTALEALMSKVYTKKRFNAGSIRTGEVKSDIAKIRRLPHFELNGFSFMPNEYESA